MLCVRNKNGFTLMELMVYIAILGVVVIVAGQAFSNSTKFRVRTTNMLKANDISEHVTSMFSEDVAQMGAKTYKVAGNSVTPDLFGRASAVYMDSTSDSSSFSLSKSTGGDSLTMKRVRFDDDGELEAVEEIAWYKRDHSLYRRCTSVSGEVSEDCPNGAGLEVHVADDIDTFQVIVAKPGVTETAGVSAAEKAVVLPKASGLSTHYFRLIPRFGTTGEGGTEYKELSFSPRDGGNFQELSNFVANYNTSTSNPDSTGKIAHQVFVSDAGVTNVVNSDTWKTLCSRVSLDSAAEYEITFNVPYTADNSRLFCPGRDHASVGFRTIAGDRVSGLDDFLFYPPAFENEPTARSFRFNVKHKVNEVCMAFTFSSYSPAPEGKITIHNLILKKVESSNYDFNDVSYNPVTQDKKNVKALKLRLVVNRGNETSDISQVVPTPSNGPRD